MGLFDDSTSGKKGEVRIGVPDDETDNSKLRGEVESRIDTASDSSESRSSSSSDVSMDDIHRQNERIIELLQKLVEDQEDSRNNSSGSSRVTDKEEDDRVRGGMDELL